MELKQCPNCNAQLKQGIFNSNAILGGVQIDLINTYAIEKSEKYCNECGRELLSESYKKFVKEKSILVKSVENLIKCIPIITIQTPFNWEYEIISIITSQSVLGTGLISEISSSFTDMFGMQSERYNKKLKESEEFCFNQLRRNALDIGANAIIATDIDYSELGGLKGMLMVCIAGTAVNVNNFHVINNDLHQNISELQVKYERLKVLLPFNELDYG